MLSALNDYKKAKRLKLSLLAVALVCSAMVGALTMGVIRSQGMEEGLDPENLGIEVRITAQRLNDGRVEFALQQRTSGAWEPRILPSSRFFPSNARVNRWLSSSPEWVWIRDVEAPAGNQMTPGSNQPTSVSGFTSFTAQQVLALRARDFCAEGFWSKATTAEVTLAIQQRADLSCEDDDTGESPLHWAAKSNSIHAIRAILARGVIVDHADANGHTPLMAAAWRNPDPAVVTALISAGANVNHRISDRRTALHIAASNDNHQVMAMLLAQGADIEAKTDTGARPFHYAAAFGTPEHLNLLAQSFASINRKDNTGWSAMHYAATNNPDPGVIQALITLRFSPDERDDEGDTPLHEAVRIGEGSIGAAATERVILALVGVGADVNARADDRRTPLMYAARYVEDVDIVRALLDSGADPKLKAPQPSGSGRFYFLARTACSHVGGRTEGLKNLDAIRNLLCN